MKATERNKLELVRLQMLAAGWAVSEYPQRRQAYEIVRKLLDANRTPDAEIS